MLEIPIFPYYMQDRLYQENHGPKSISGGDVITIFCTSVCGTYCIKKKHQLTSTRVGCAQPNCRFQQDTFCSCIYHTFVLVTSTSVPENATTCGNTHSIGTVLNRKVMEKSGTTRVPELFHLLLCFTWFVKVTKMLNVPEVVIHCFCTYYDMH